MNSVHASRFPRFRVLISAKRSEKACRCTVVTSIPVYQWMSKPWYEYHHRYFETSVSIGISRISLNGHCDFESFLVQCHAYCCFFSTVFQILPNLHLYLTILVTCYNLVTSIMVAQSGCRSWVRNRASA